MTVFERSIFLAPRFELSYIRIKGLHLLKAKLLSPKQAQWLDPFLQQVELACLGKL
jgi:hypothetical protein